MTNTARTVKGLTAIRLISCLMVLLLLYQIQVPAEGLIE